MFDLDFVRDDVLRHLHKRKISDPRRAGSWKDFLGRASYAASMTLREPEIVTFAVLQWVVVALTYYLWVQIIGWIPEAVWESEAAHVRWPLNIVVTVWSLGCVALAAYPIGLLTGCTAAAHLLHQQGMPCSIARCLAIVLPKAGTLWTFHVADGWLTVDQIVERLPKKKRRMSIAARASSELAYYAWKVGTVGMVPAIVAGHAQFAAAEQSVALVKARMMDVLILRGSYSAACWVVGIGSYVGAVLFTMVIPGVFQSDRPLFTFYLWMGVPILAAAAVVKIVLRPIFIISASRLYSDFMGEHAASLLPEKQSNALRAAVGFGALAVVVGTVFLYREQLGLMWILRAGQ